MCSACCFVSSTTNSGFLDLTQYLEEDVFAAVIAMQASSTKDTEKWILNCLKLRGARWNLFLCGLLARPSAKCPLHDEIIRSKHSIQRHVSRILNSGYSGKWPKSFSGRQHCFLCFASVFPILNAGLGSSVFCWGVGFSATGDKWVMAVFHRPRIDGLGKIPEKCANSLRSCDWKGHFFHWTLRKTSF